MFDLRRFLRLARVHWAEHGRATLWFLAIGVAVHFCIWLLITRAMTEAESYDGNMQSIVFGVGYALSGLLFAGRHFSCLADTSTAQTYLLRPASVFEKMLLAFVVVALLYPLAYTLAFQVVNLPGAGLGSFARDALVRASEDENVRIYQGGQTYGPYVPFAGNSSPTAVGLLFCGVALLQGFVVAGMVAFRRLAWLKTLVALFLLAVVAVPLFALVTDSAPYELLPHWSQVGRERPAGLQAWIWFLWIAVPALVWVSAFLHLRDREQP